MMFSSALKVAFLSGYTATTPPESPCACTTHTHQHHSSEQKLFVACSESIADDVSVITMVLSIALLTYASQDHSSNEVIKH